MSNWKRPPCAKQSLIYSMFEAFDSFGERLCYKIEDLQEDRFEEVLKLLTENFIRDDPMMSSKRVKEDSQSVEELNEYWRKLLNQKISLVCFEETSSEIVGVSLLGKFN